MGWISLAESAESALPCPPGSAQSPTVSETDTLKALCCRECGAGELAALRSGTTCGLCGATCFVTERILSTVVSPARTSALLEMERAWKASEAVLFSRYSASLPKSNRASSFWKTSRRLGPVGQNGWGKNWPASGMIVDGTLYPLPKSEPRISEKDGSFLPTPTANDYGTSNNGKRGDGTTFKQAGKKSLFSMARAGQWPTPNATDHKGPSTRSPGKERPIGDDDLPTRVARCLWPTPRTTGLDGGSNSRKAAKERGMWPTPKASDGEKGIRTPDGCARMMERANRKNGQDLPTMAGGTLNPTWVEWLMGYPLGWTVLEDWAMQWYRPKRAKPSAVSQESKK